MTRTKKGTIALGATLLAGTVGAVLPAAAAPGPLAQPAAAPPERREVRGEAARVKAVKPLVMLVCREVRGPGPQLGRQNAPRAADLACVTRWAGF